MNKKICLITFSNNADHQNTIYSMFRALYPNNDVYTIGISNPKSNIAPHTKNNFYINCPKRPGFEKDSFNLVALKKIKKFIDDNKIDLLYFESQHLWNMFVMILCKRIKKVVVVHDVIPHDENKMVFLSNFITCHQADHIILRNSKYKERLAKDYRLNIDKITSFELWRDYPAPKELTYSKTFLCFGRIRNYKGFDLLAKIIEKTPSIKYRIVGEADEESKYLIDYIKDFKNVSLCNREVSDTEMIEEFRKADWVILPYRSATQSGVIIDAYKFARPVISFNVGAIKEQIEDGKTGFLVEPENIDNFAIKIKEVNKYSEEKLKNFSNSAYNYGYNNYSADMAAEDFHKLLMEIIEKSV